MISFFLGCNKVYFVEIKERRNTFSAKNINCIDWVELVEPSLSSPRIYKPSEKSSSSDIITTLSPTHRMDTQYKKISKELTLSTIAAEGFKCALTQGSFKVTLVICALTVDEEKLLTNGAVRRKDSIYFPSGTEFPFASTFFPKVQALKAIGFGFTLVSQKGNSFRIPSELNCMQTRLI